jgi:chemotaxis signal transduction protein
LREGDFVSIGHAGEKSSKVKFSMRKYKCYEILEDRLGHPPSDSRPLNRCIVFKTANDLARLPHPPENHDMADSDPTGLLVDAIGDILPPETRVLPPPPEALSGLDTRFVAGVISSNEGLITVLQIGNLVSISESKKNAA